MYTVGSALEGVLTASETAAPFSQGTLLFNAKAALVTCVRLACRMHMIMS